MISSYISSNTMIKDWYKCHGEILGQISQLTHCTGKVERDTYVLLTSGGTLVNIQDFTKDGNNNRIIMVIVYDFIYLCYFISCFRYGKRFSSICGDIIVLCIVGIIIYAIYRTCIADGSHGQSGDSSFRSHDRGSRPPPPGFRQDYMPNNGGKYWLGFWRLHFWKKYIHIYVYPKQQDCQWYFHQSVIFGHSLFVTRLGSFLLNTLQIQMQ